MLKEQNGRLVDEATGEDVVLHGVNRNGLECWSDNSGIFDIVRVALEEWHADTIRLPLSRIDGLDMTKHIPKRNTVQFWTSWWILSPKMAIM